MKELKEIIHKIDDELEDAKCYAMLSVEHKEIGDMSKGKVYHQLATDELSHATQLHDMSVKMINEIGVDPPQYMLDMWEEEHQEYMEETAKIKYILDMFKN